MNVRAEYEIHEGDILMSRANTRELLGSAAIVRRVRPRLLLCDKLYRIAVNQNLIMPEFLTIALRTTTARFQFEREATGASGSMQNISQDTIANLLLPAPPLPEQQAIVDAISSATDRTTRLVSRIRSAFDRLAELRLALISAAVTGQIDVREEAA